MPHSPMVTIKRAGGPRLSLWNDKAGAGFEVPAGPWEGLAPRWVVPLVPDAEVVAEGLEAVTGEIRAAGKAAAMAARAAKKE